MATERSSSDPVFLAAYGAAVSSVREDLGLDRKELAETAGISYSYLSAIESGQKLPSGTVQTKLAEALDIAGTPCPSQRSNCTTRAGAQHAVAP